MNRLKSLSSRTSLPPAPRFISQNNERERLRTYLQHGYPTCLVGPSGVGKTSLTLELADELGFEVFPIQGNLDLTSADLEGRWMLQDGCSVWQDGALAQAVRAKGPALAYFDELAEVPVGVLATLLSLLDHRRALMLSSRPEMLRAPDTFGFVAAYNPTYGAGGAGNRLTPALLQRMAFVRFQPLRRTSEESLLERYVPKDVSHRLVGVAQLTRTQLRSSLSEGASTRLLIRAAEAIALGHCPDEAIMDLVVLPLTEDPEAQLSVARALQSAGLLGKDGLAPYRLIEPQGDPEVVSDEDFLETHLSA